MEMTGDQCLRNREAKKEVKARTKETEQSGGDGVHQPQWVYLEEPWADVNRRR